MQTFVGGTPGQTYTPQRPAIQSLGGSMQPVPVPQPGQPAPQAAAPGAPARTQAQFAPDAQYLAEAAQRQFGRTTSLDQLTAEDDAQRNQTQEAIRRLMEDATTQRQSTTEGAAKQGLFYSGQLGKRLGDLESQLARQRADVQSQYDNGARARAVARQAILSGAPLEEAAGLAAAAERQVGRDTDAANARQLVPTVVKPKPKPKPKKKKR
jgi:hypothetical protein